MTRKEKWPLVRPDRPAGEDASIEREGGRRDLNETENEGGVPAGRMMRQQPARN